MNHHRVIAAAAALMLPLFLYSAEAAEPFTLTSSAFKDGDIWPSKFAGADPEITTPPCPGQNLSPPLAWANAPEKTKTFAIVMQDPDGGLGLGSIHWVAYAIPRDKTFLAEGEASSPPTAWIGGKNLRGKGFYFGPCGPAGQALHHYHFNVIATDLDATALPPGLTRDELMQALRGHALGTAGIVGRYTRPSP